MSISSSKGFGFYTKEETLIFLGKAALLSFWLGLDALAVLLVCLVSVAELTRHPLLALVVLAVLISGTVFSVLCAGVVGTAPGNAANGRGGAKLATVRKRLQAERHLLIGLGIGATCVLVLIVASLISHFQSRAYSQLRIDRADPGLAAKCAEVARLEHQLFFANELFVMAQCLLQYDAKYNELRKTKTQAG